MIHKNWAVSNLKERISEELYKTKNLDRGSRKLHYTKMQVGYCEVAFLQGIVEVCPVDNLTSMTRLLMD